jgi:hypothetical protein
MTETKIAPTEPKSREQREARVAASKKVIDQHHQDEGHRQGGQHQDGQSASVAGTVRQRSDKAACSLDAQGGQTGSVTPPLRLGSF